MQSVHTNIEIGTIASAQNCNLYSLGIISGLRGERYRQGRWSYAPRPSTANRWRQGRYRRGARGI